MHIARPNSLQKSPHLSTYVQCLNIKHVDMQNLMGAKMKIRKEYLNALL